MSSLFRMKNSRIEKNSLELKFHEMNMANLLDKTASFWLLLLLLLRLSASIHMSVRWNRRKHLYVSHAMECRPYTAGTITYYSIAMATVTGQERNRGKLILKLFEMEFTSSSCGTPVLLSLFHFAIEMQIFARNRTAQPWWTNGIRIMLSNQTQIDLPLIVSTRLTEQYKVHRCTSAHFS